MKNEKQYQHQEKTETKGGGRKLSWISRLGFSNKDHLPVPTVSTVRGGRSKERQFIILIFGMIMFYTIKEIILSIWGEDLVEAASNELSYRYTDEDYLLSEDSSLCLLPSVMMEDYSAYKKAEVERDSLVAIFKHLPPAERPDHGYDLDTPIELLQRPRINVDRLVYFEKLTKDRVRLIYDNGSCEIYDFKDMLYNLQDENQCLQFEAIPRDGQVTEYINLLYVESFERVKCQSKVLYRAKMGVDYSTCASLRSIMDCGVGLFSVYVYRKLRSEMERLNPHNDFKYRRTVELEACEC